MDRSQQTYSSLDELRQIQFEARRSTSLEDLRNCFQRVQNLRRVHVDDFDMQLVIAEVQEEIIEHARVLREQPKEEPASLYVEENPSTHLVRRSATPSRAREESLEIAEIPPDVPQVDKGTWKRATYLALVFTAIVLAAFFYLIQAARKINLTPAEVASEAARQPPANTKPAPAQSLPLAATPPPAPPPTSNPTVRLYTDLLPGTVSIDGGNPQDLKDGQLILDNLPPGRHSIKVVGRGGNAAFSFDVAQKGAPQVVGVPSASNAMAVLVSAQDGEGRLVTNAENSDVTLDGKPAGAAGADGLTLGDLGKTDHDLQIAQDKDRQRFVLTYAAAPTLTAYLKSDPNAGTVLVSTALDGVDVYINDALYRRKTDRGQLRIPLKVGDYTIRIHKAGYTDPPPETVTVKKAEEAALQFHLQALPELAALQIKGALPGTMVYVDKDFAGNTAADGSANISNLKPGDHVIELRRDGALPKRFERTFNAGDAIVLSGPDVMLDKIVTENSPPAAAPPLAAPEIEKPTYAIDMEGSQVRRGGGFVPYHVPKVPGHYTFSAQGHLGGFIKHSKLQWYAGYEDAQNYVLFTLDGKHATVRQVRDGKSEEISRVPFNVDSNEWVEADVAVKANEISARVRKEDGTWSDIGSVFTSDRNFTQGKVGFYIPSNDEVSVSNFKFSNR